MILLDNNLKDLTQPSLVLTHAQFSKKGSITSSPPAVSQRPGFHFTFIDLFYCLLSLYLFLL